MRFQPWKTEPDEKEFLHDGYRCYIRRNQHTLTFCGYVDLPSTHPWAGKHYSDESLCHTDVHGGLTYSGWTEDGFYRIGFDCYHYGDYSPGLKTPLNSGAEYRDLYYVEKECIHLAQQAFKARGDDR